MKILLDNHNEQVASVVNICCERIGADLVAYSADESEYDLTIKNYEDGDDISKFDLNKTLFLTPKNVSVPGARYTLTKPFSPLELITFISEFSVQNMSVQAKEKMAKEFADASSVMKEIDAIDQANSASGSNFEELVDSFYDSGKDIPLSQLANDIAPEIADDVPLSQLVGDMPRTDEIADDIPLSQLADEAALADTIADDTPLNAVAEKIADNIADDMPLNLAASDIPEDVPLNSIGTSEPAENNNAPQGEISLAKDDAPIALAALDDENPKNFKTNKSQIEDEISTTRASETLPLAQQDEPQRADSSNETAVEKKADVAPNLEETKDSANVALKQHEVDGSFAYKTDEKNSASQVVQDAAGAPVNSGFDMDFSRLFDSAGMPVEEFGGYDNFAAAAFASDEKEEKRSAHDKNKTATDFQKTQISSQYEVASDTPIALAGAGDIPRENLYNAVPFQSMEFTSGLAQNAPMSAHNEAWNSIGANFAASANFVASTNSTPAPNFSELNLPHILDASDLPKQSEQANSVASGFADGFLRAMEGDFANSFAANSADSEQFKSGKPAKSAAQQIKFNASKPISKPSERAEFKTHKFGASEQVNEMKFGAQAIPNELAASAAAEFASLMASELEPSVKSEPLRNEHSKKPSAEELKTKLRDDLEAGIANTIEKFAGSKDAKDALKDFKINIDISFGDR
ncbi:hypothetical protein [uncultured Campylobacter sp.]|uniref:hypothetical protein n=1 Tax=uncultured Campylobacter sp. TaxID=218934 RepID=UPI00260CC3D6|nr:hypothetical protein [uncultured Campylobacter sp.]